MSTILNRIPGKGAFSSRNHQRESASNANSQRRNANLLSAPVVVDLDDCSTLSSFKIGDGEEKTNQFPKRERKDAISPGTSSFSGFKGFCRRAYRKLGLKHGLSTTLIILYTLLGAAVFLIMEKDSDVKRLNRKYEGYLEEKKEFVRWFVNATSISRSVRRLQAKRMFEKRLQMYEDKIGFAIQKETDWNFWHAMYFAGTIYSTIGYGDIYCRTVAGRLFTMVYSIIGIPLVLSVLTDLGSLLLKCLYHLTRLYNTFASYAFSGGRSAMQPALAKLSNSSMGNNKSTSRIKIGPDEEIKADEDATECEEGLESIGEIDDLEEMERREAEEYEYQLTRVPVTAALLATIGWIFLCAGLYCFWEDWDYFTSIYFFFISLSTIGLGDESPNRKDIMVATYALVILGLALVSMCITIIQRRLEDLYLQLLRKILQEYHKRLRDGEDQMGATLGIMKFWHKNKAAKFLVPLLSKDKKQNVAQKFQDEAKVKGFAIPAVLQDLDPKSGLPAILKMAKNKMMEGQAKLREKVSQAIRRAAEKVRRKHEPDDDAAMKAMYSVQAEQLSIPLCPLIPAPPDPSRSPAQLTWSDANVQTDDGNVSNRGTAVDAETQWTWINGQVDKSTQTVVMRGDNWTQCSLEEPDVNTPSTNTSMVDSESQTDVVKLKEAAVQTQKVACRDQIIQANADEAIGTQARVETVGRRNQESQTPVPEIVEKETQTGALDEQPQQAPPVPSHSWGKAKTNLHDIIRKAMAGMASKPKAPTASSPTESVRGPTMASWDDIDGERSNVTVSDEEPEAIEEMPSLAANKLKAVAKRVRGNLDWDPVDGLHAERQRRVSDLKDIFESPWRKKATDNRH